MAHNQAMLEKRSADWGDKLRIVGLSIDNAAETVKTHIEAKKWSSVEHYHVRTEGCVADKEHGIKGVPHVMLVDTEGKIVFKGHPASRPNLEDDFDQLLKGEKITGAGTESVDASSAAAEGDKIGQEEGESAIAKFKVDSSAFKEENKDSFANFQRAFLVLVSEGTYNFTEHAFKYELTCHSVLMGGGDKTEAMKEKMEAVNKGPWKNQSRYA